MATVAAPDGRTLAIIASTMRSGSTLLKALLQQAPDVSQLSEVNFQRFARPEADPAQMWALDPRPILLLKRPAWYGEQSTYPRLPEITPRRVILLVRDCCATVESLRKMTFGPVAGWVGPAVDGWLARRYWAVTNGRLAELADSGNPGFQLVRYEDLVARPVEITRQLFAWLGSVQAEGVSSYQPPIGRTWRWGRDDNSRQIRTLQVQPPSGAPCLNSRLRELSGQDPGISAVRRRLGYGD